MIPKLTPIAIATPYRQLNGRGSLGPRAASPQTEVLTTVTYCNPELTSFLFEHGLTRADLARHLQVDYKLAWRWSQKYKLTRIQRLALAGLAQELKENHERPTPNSI